MSGGVDSAVAALAAREAGHEVVAVTLELWADPRGRRQALVLLAGVGRRRARARALARPAAHHARPARRRSSATVVDDFVAEHAAGRTPNPCVRCNGLVRFDAMLDLARRARRGPPGHGPLRAHRARRATARSSPPRPTRTRTSPTCSPALDPALLDRLWFPLAELEKPRVRELAAEAQPVAVADKPESQDLCFLAGVPGPDLLARRGRGGPPGPIVDTDGNVLGTHDGHHLFTVGQRRGIGVTRTRAALRDPQGPGHEPRHRRAEGRAEDHDGPPGPESSCTARPSEVTHVKLRYRSAPGRLPPVTRRPSTVHLDDALRSSHPRPDRRAPARRHGDRLGHHRRPV